MNPGNTQNIYILTPSLYTNTVNEHTRTEAESVHEDPISLMQETADIEAQ